MECKGKQWKDVKRNGNNDNKRKSMERNDVKWTRKGWKGKERKGNEWNGKMK